MSCKLQHWYLNVSSMWTDFLNFLFFSLSTAVLCFLISALGVTAGAHRLWSHRSYKASTPLRIFLASANSMAFQVCKTDGSLRYRRTGELEPWLEHHFIIVEIHWDVNGVSYCCLYLKPQNDIFEWARDHRVHHKYSETDADPHNAVRGFFYAHIGWLLVRKHPDVIEKGRKLELNDLLSDKVVMFQRRWEAWLWWILQLI